MVACAKRVLKSKIKMALTRKRRLIFQYSKSDTVFGNIPTLFWEKKIGKWLNSVSVINETNSAVNHMIFHFLQIVTHKNKP